MRLHGPDEGGTSGLPFSATTSGVPVRSGVFPGFRSLWSRATLATRFGATGGIVLVLASLAIGSVVAERIEAGVVRNTAIATALYMESFVAPISQDLAGGGPLSPNVGRALDEVFRNTSLGQRVVSYKIWRPDGTVLIASDPDIVGQGFPIDSQLQAALNGVVSASYDDAGDGEDAAEAALGVPLLEIYSPIREAWSGRIVAVAEFYEMNPQLAADLAQSRRAAWAWVAGVTLVLGLVLHLIVLQGSRTIEAQKRALDHRLGELRDLNARNHELRLRVQEAAGRAAATTEHSLRRIGADLHDGPAQYLAFAALRLDTLREDRDGEERQKQLDAVHDALTTAMSEVRAISRGLALPDIETKDAETIVRMAVEAHAGRTGETVALKTGMPSPLSLGPAESIGLFRFVQEGLNNASRHAGGQDVAVVLTTGEAGLSLAIRDRGPGLGDAKPGLGLSGLRDRIEALGGSFRCRNRDGGGTEIEMNFGTRGRE